MVMRNILIVFFFISSFVQAQDNNSSSFFDVNYFKGNIMLHTPEVQQLITGHPEGFLIGWNKKTIGEKVWQQRFNYPDYGITYSYQKMKNEFLGENHGLYAHYNFYFLKRNLMMRVGQGLAYTTNPYDKERNFKNNAYGSRILSTTLLMLNYKKNRLIGPVGLETGITFLHYSNANVKAPNTSTNSMVFNIGLTYDLTEKDPEYIKTAYDKKITEPVRYNFVFRYGINESDIMHSGQYPFYVFSVYADKRINTSSAIQLGTDVFYSTFLKEYIRYYSTAAPNYGVNADDDWVRAGVFIGHELFINKLSLLTQFGYYTRYPVKFEDKTYQRIGLKYYFGKKLFSAVTLKTHYAKAEAVEFGLGIRL